MAPLICSAITSLDGYVADEDAGRRGRRYPGPSRRGPVRTGLVDERRLRSGVVHLHYRVRTGGGEPTGPA